MKSIDKNTEDTYYDSLKDKASKACREVFEHPKRQFISLIGIDMLLKNDKMLFYTYKKVIMLATYNGKENTLVLDLDRFNENPESEFIYVLNKHGQQTLLPDIQLVQYLQLFCTFEGATKELLYISDLERPIEVTEIVSIAQQQKLQKKKKVVEYYFAA
jgi:hypothetical protein